MLQGIQGGLSVLPASMLPQVEGGGLSTTSPLNSGEKRPKKRLTDEELLSFGNLGGTTDVKGKAAYLAKKGLIGADQLLSDQPDISTKEGIINAQSDWKTAAMQSMLIQARKLGLRTPAEISANRAALLGALPPRLKDAINNPSFKQIHPNWWETFDSVLKDKYDQEDLMPPQANLTVK